MEILVDGTRVYTEGMDEFDHPNLSADCGEREYVDEATAIVERLSEIIQSGVKHFHDGERLSFQTALIELHLVDGVLELWEPAGTQWRPGIRRGLELLTEVEALAEDHDVDEDGIELNLVCSVSPHVGKARRVTMRRRAAFSNHSGWEIIAAEDEGNPACLAHPTLASLWKRETRLLPYLCLPVGTEVRWDSGTALISHPQETPQAVWEEPDEVWAHHDPSDAAEADWMVAGRLNPQRAGVPTWEWIPLRRTGPHTGVVCATPFLLHGIALGDEVRVNTHGVIDRRINTGGRVAIRVEVESREDGSFIDDLIKQGHRCEWMNDVVVAIDCASDREANELIRQIEQLDGHSIVSHSFAYQPRSLNRSFLSAAARASVSVGSFLGLFAALWVEGSRMYRFDVAMLLVIANITLLWLLTLSRWTITVFDSRHPRLYIARLMTTTWAALAGLILLSLELVSGIDTTTVLAISGAGGIVGAALLGNHDRVSPLPRVVGEEIAPPFYRYASASLDDGLVELLVAESGGAQAIITRGGDVQSRSYRSFYEGATALDAEFGIGRGTWWYGRR